MDDGVTLSAVGIHSELEGPKEITHVKYSPPLTTREAPQQAVIQAHLHRSQYTPGLGSSSPPSFVAALFITQPTTAEYSI